MNGYPDFSGKLFATTVCLAKDKAWRIAAQRALQKTKETVVKFGGNYVARVRDPLAAAALEDAIEDYEMRYGPVKVKAKGATE